MNRFDAGLNNQIVRTAAGASYLAPSINEQAQHAITTLNKVNAFIGRFKETRGFSTYHPSMIANTVTNAESLVKGVSLASARGFGRLATITDHTLSNGCGMVRAAKAIEKLFGLDATWTLDERTQISYPVVNGGLPKSSLILNELGLIIEERAKYVDDRRIRKVTRDNLLLKQGWSDHRLIGFTIEWLSRAFAYQMDSEVRSALVKGDKHTSLKAAMDTLRFAPA